MSVASVAQLLQQQGGGGGGGNVNDIIAGNGIIVNDNGFGDYTVENNGVVYGINGAGIGLNLAQDGGLTVTNTGVVSLTAGAGIALDATTGDITITNTGGGGGGVTSIIAGNGINVDANTGDVTVTSVVNPADYLTTANAALTYQPILTYTPYIYQKVFVAGGYPIGAGQFHSFNTPGEEFITNIPYNANTIYQFTFTSGVNSPPLTLVSYTPAINAPGINTIFTSTVFYNSSSTDIAYLNFVTIFGMVPNV